ncbi:hypothetical protein AOQ84DRAFT_379646 [Glonium stellatum]|uniref:Leucine-rich repeat domain-containing protein n=1 Tax=Glonium stellatum TaxID=574774 RepID=A0A8E2EUX5_9PEZI|nr:hypothetical protein AOQ84DRAFT_379646 [Glonium stellatum]
MTENPASWPYGRLSKLKKLCVKYDGNIYASLSRVAGFFHLPSLQIFEAERIVDEDLDCLQGWTCPMGSSSVTAIKLLDCSLSVPRLQALVGSCNRLTSLTSEFTDSSERSVYRTSDLFEVLTPHKLVLERLALVSILFDPYNNLEPYFWDSFHDFTALKTLKVEEESLIHDSKAIGHPEYVARRSLLKILPSSLETLTVIRCSVLVIPRLLEIAAPDYPFPRLEAIIVDIQGSLDFEKFDLLKVVFALLDVEFRCTCSDANSSSRESNEWITTKDSEEVLEQ